MITLRQVLVQTLACSAALVLLPLSPPSRASAQEVEWRYDYSKARQEAVEKGRPLVIDFVTDSCVFCQRMDMGTFRDPGIVAQLNRYCIPLKIDGNRQLDLVQKLRIDSYPTLVFASYDGRVLGAMVGEKEAAVLKVELEKVIATGDPEWMLRNYAEALHAREAGDFARALGLLKPILEQGNGRTVCIRAAQQVHELEQLASARKAQAAKAAEVARQAEARKPVPTPAPAIQNQIATVVPAGPLFPTNKMQPKAPQATTVSQTGNAMTEISRVIKGALASRPLYNVVLSGHDEPLRVRLAQDTLLQAQEDYRRQQYLACLDRCEMLVANYGDLKESQEAQQMANEIKKNPEWTKLACDQLGERLGILYLNLAETWLGKGEPQQAIYYLERVIQTAPNSRHAEKAQIRLTQLQGQPMPKNPELKRGPDTRSE